MSGALLDSPEGAFRLLEETLDRSPAEQTEAVLFARTAGLTRFADSRIHQNVAEENVHLLVRVALDGRVAGVRTSRLHPRDLAGLSQQALAMARQTRPDPDFPGLPGPVGAPVLSDRAVTATSEATPRQRAEGVRVFVTACAGCSAAGALATAATTVAVANTKGVRAYGRISKADVVSVVQQGDGSAYVNAVAADLTDLDLAALGARAARQAKAAEHPIDLEPGIYPVVLESPAVGLMLNYLALTTFNGKAILEGRSALATRMGEQIMAPPVQIWDDPADPGTIGLPFDYEGVPKRRLDLVRDGKAVGAAYDSRTARQAGVANTAHAQPQPNAFGPVPTNVIMAPGPVSRDDLVASVERGVLITRFHYVRVVHPTRTVITGMTRDGTFLIEGGRVARALKNLRFNQAMIDAFAGVEAVGRTGALVGDVSPAFAPPIKVREFIFTSRTLF